MKNKIKMYFWRIASKRYVKNPDKRTYDLIDSILCYIVNDLLKNW